MITGRLLEQDEGVVEFPKTFAYLDKPLSTFYQKPWENM